MNVPERASELSAHRAAKQPCWRHEGDDKRNDKRDNAPPPARRAGAVRLLRREAARTDEGEATASGTWGRGSGDGDVMYGDKDAAGCDLITLFVCLRVLGGSLALTGA